VIDGLRHPHFCGGITEVGKGLWMRRQDMQIDKLVAYALRLGIGAVLRRLGYLLEQYELGTQKHVAQLQEALTPTYLVLDPTLPKEGPHLKRWRLQINVAPEEIKGIREG
jgi:predicted transcriptional regulator of viral defense system